MRCIEMIERFLNKYCFRWLTLTWDVLKCAFSYNSTYQVTGLTLTWDVLKLPPLVTYWFISSRLTLTWDVLKFLPYDYKERQIQD